MEHSCMECIFREEPGEDMQDKIKIMNCYMQAVLA